MIICGLKLTHDGSVAVIDNDRLLFSIELEKLQNNPRYTSIEDTGMIASILQAEGLATRHIDRFVIDGWGGYDEEALAVQPRLTIGREYNTISCANGMQQYELPVAQYQERTPQHDVLQPLSFSGLQTGVETHAYESYLHVTGHVAGAFCTSPFAAEGRDAYVLVWDGGMYPRLYYVEAATGHIENLGPVFLLIGNIYTIFSQHFGPFRVPGNFAKDNLSVAGKVMAWIALGELRRELFALFDEIYEKFYDKPMGFANVFANECRKRLRDRHYRDEDVLRSFHVYLEELLVQKLAKKIKRFNRPCKNLCIAGGCALNIKWNSAVRNAGLFERVYVPPFPNDSGSAIGMACAAMMHAGAGSHLVWNVYSGPRVLHNEPATGWEKRPCPPAALARLLYETKEPVVALNGRAELGPRALGNRSILADPSLAGMKDVLNQVKEREDYRPVSPICLEHKAPEIFEPGMPDPHMLFDHVVKPEWLPRIPAVCHLDGTARLQTVNAAENKLIATLLTEYEKLSGIPMLCNTSANYKGAGFFPDIASACAWNRVNYVWCEEMLYSRTERIVFEPIAALFNFSI